VAANSPTYRPADALRDQALIDSRLSGMGERIGRNERRLDDLEKLFRGGKP